MTTAYRLAAIGGDGIGPSSRRQGRVATPDIGGSATMQKVGDAIAAIL